MTVGQEIDLLQFPRVERELGRRTDEHREIARRFDQEFFDGSRDTGYGGYRYDGRWRKVACRLMAQYGLWRGNTLLDVGCAKGFLVSDLNALGVLAYGVDVSPYAIMKARSTHCCVMNAAELDFDAGQFDVVVSINTVHNLQRKQCIQALQHIQRVARRGAYVMVDAYRTDEQRERMLSWNLTAQTILHVDGWLELFKEAGYTGDYGWFWP